MTRTSAIRTRLPLLPDSLAGNLMSKRAAHNLQISCGQFVLSQQYLCSAIAAERQIQTHSLHQSRCLFAALFLHLHAFVVSAPFRALAQDGVLTCRLDDFGRWRDLACRCNWARLGYFAPCCIGCRQAAETLRSSRIWEHASSSKTEAKES